MERKNSIGTAVACERLARAALPFDGPPDAHKCGEDTRRTWRANGSRGHGEDSGELRHRLAVVQPLGEHAQGQGLDARDGLIAGGAVRHRAGQLRHLGQPAAVALLLDLDREFYTGAGSSSTEKRAAAYDVPISLVAPGTARYYLPSGSARLEAPI